MFGTVEGNTACNLEFVLMGSIRSIFKMSEKVMKVKRPEFEAFREIFLNCLSREINQDRSVYEKKKWADLGEPEIRRKILESVNKKLKKDYGVEFEINQRLLSVEGPVESAIIQTFHELNTIILMERINAKIRYRLN